MRRILGVLAALGAAACSNPTTGTIADLRGPVAAVAYVGYNPVNPRLGKVPLLAVAASRGNELRVIDPSTDRPVMSPNFSTPLAVPTLQRPIHLASVSMGDGGTDVLVVASGGTVVQLVGTWLDGSNGFGVAQTWDLSGLAGGGSEILCLAAGPVPSGPPAGTPPVAQVTPGRARVVVGFAGGNDGLGGKLVSIDLVRNAADGSIAVAGTVPQVRRLGFDPGALAFSPDIFHLYASSTDVITDDAGRSVLGVAEIDTLPGAAPSWTVRALNALGPTGAIAAAFVGERLDTWTNFGAPALRVYAALEPSGCGPTEPVACGIAAIDPARAGAVQIAADPAPPGPVPAQPFQAPMYMPSLPFALATALPPAVAASVAPGQPYGSQRCVAPPIPGDPSPACPEGVNTFGVPQAFMLFAPATGQLWSTAAMFVTSADGNAYVQDLGRYGPPNMVSMFNDDTTKVQVTSANPVGPAGPVSNTPLLGFPPGTTALGMWQDHPVEGNPVSVVFNPTELRTAIIIWPGFTPDDHWLASYQGLLPGLSQRRAVLGLRQDDQGRDRLYLGIQDSLVQAPGGTLPETSTWVTGAFVNDPQLGIHAEDLTQFILDADPCPSTRPNWVPANSTTPAYDSTEPPVAHEANIEALLPVNALLYPGGALQLAPPADPVLAQEYACLVGALRALPGQVLTAFRTNPPSTDYVRGAWLRAGGMVLVGQTTGYAGRPVLDRRYDFAWADESTLTGEALALARKARRFYYPATYDNCPPANPDCYAAKGLPELTNPMQPGPVVGFRLGRYCLASVSGCDATTSPPARDAGVEFYTRSGVVAMYRRPLNTSGGTGVTTFDKSILAGQEYLGRVFYATYVGDALFMVPPGLDVGQAVTIR